VLRTTDALENANEYTKDSLFVAYFIVDVAKPGFWRYQQLCGQNKGKLLLRCSREANVK